MAAAKESFTGKEQDVESNLYYFGARYYDPAAARWLSVDPLAGKYPSLSPYNYVANNPLRLIDPDGKDIRYSIDEQNKTVNITIRANFTGKDANSSSVKRWKSGIKRVYSRTLSSGSLKGFKVNTSLDATINAKSSKTHYQIKVEPTITGKERSKAVVGANKTLADGTKAIMHDMDTGNDAAHETGHIMGNPDEYEFEDKNGDGYQQEGEVTEEDPGSIMGNYKIHSDVDSRDRHIYKAIETADQENKDKQ